MRKILVLVAIVLSLLCTPIYASWEYAGMDSWGNQFFMLPESSRLIKFTPKILEWSIEVKEVYSSEGRQRIIDIYNLHDLDTNGLEFLDYDLKTCHFKIWDNKVGYRIDNAYGYHNSGKMVYNFGGWHAFEAFDPQTPIGLASYRALEEFKRENHIDYFVEYSKLQS